MRLRIGHMYGGLAVAGVAVAFAAAPAGASAADCQFAWLGGNGSGWDSEEANGDFYDGALIPTGPGIDYISSELRDDPFDDYGIATVDGNPYNNADTDKCKREGRTNRFPADEPVSDIKVTPELYVSKDRALGRQLVTLKNTGSSNATVEFTFDGDLGSDTLARVARSSSGDAGVNDSDVWATSCEDAEADGCANQEDLGRDAELAHNWERKGNKQDSADFVFLTNGDSGFNVRFDDVKLKPGQSKSFVEIVQMARTIGEANKAVKRIEDGPGYLFAGLNGKERGRIQNW